MLDQSSSIFTRIKTTSTAELKVSLQYIEIDDYDDDDDQGWSNFVKVKN